MDQVLLPSSPTVLSRILKYKDSIWEGKKIGINSKGRKEKIDRYGLCCSDLCFLPMLNQQDCQGQ